MRKPRLEYLGAVYHVIARGNQRQNVFWDDGDHVRYLKLLGENLERRSLKLYGYCLMTNHVHLLVEQGSSYPLSKYMQRLQSAYTSFFNRKHKKWGHLFQGRYKAVLVDKDRYLLSLVKYIHLNPKRAKMETQIGQYHWTSHRQYLGKEEEPLAKVHTREVLEKVAKDPAKARAEYSIFMEQDDGSLLERVNALWAGRILGKMDFVKKVLEVAGEPSEKPLTINKPIAEIWRDLLKRDGMAQEPAGRIRSRLMAEAAFIGVEYSGLSQKEIGDHFGLDQAAISMALKRLKQKWVNEEGAEAALAQWARQLL
jgi:REP element-mobilizing transposase RayT